MSAKFNSREYWERRYRNGGNSGLGSYGSAAEYKTNVINDILTNLSIDSVIEYGCGDGNQIKNIKYKSYLGFDFGPAVQRCKDTYRQFQNLDFKNIDLYSEEVADLTISLDVIYHLIEKEVYDQYLERLFRSAQKYCLVYTTNYTNDVSVSNHIRHREFINYVKDTFSDFEIIDIAKYSEHYKTENPSGYTHVNFYLFKRI